MAAMIAIEGQQAFRVESAQATVVADAAPVRRKSYADLFPNDDSLCDAF